MVHGEGCGGKLSLEPPKPLQNPCDLAALLKASCHWLRSRGSIGLRAPGALSCERMVFLVTFSRVSLRECDCATLEATWSQTSIPSCPKAQVFVLSLGWMPWPGADDQGSGPRAGTQGQSP